MRGEIIRLFNYLNDEDDTLCLAWEAVTLDTICEVEQTGYTY
jgi:hypothetical protein